MILCPVCGDDFPGNSRPPDFIFCRCRQTAVHFWQYGLEIRFGYWGDGPHDHQLHVVRKDDGELRGDFRDSFYGRTAPDDIEAAFRRAVDEAVVRKVMVS